MSETEFASLFPGAEEAAIAVRQVISRYVPGDMGRVRASDRIAQDLMVDAADGLNTNDIISSLERRFNICLPEDRASQVLTVEELVKLIQSLRDDKLTGCSNKAPAHACSLDLPDPAISSTLAH